MRSCHFCAAALDAQMEVHRATTCSACGKDLKICLNCRFYSKGVHNECLETSAEPVRDKDRSNFCDYFRFRESAGPRMQTGGAMEDFQKLFGDGE